MFDLETSIKNWKRLFNRHQAFDHGTLHEMELHLRDHIEDLVADGKSEKEAFDLAVSDFGEIPSMASEEFTNIRRKKTFRTMLYTTMFRNYYKTSLRTIMRNPLNSFINLFGLSAAIGICVVAYSFIRYTYKIDQFHENKNEVYLTTFFADRDGAEQQNGTTPVPLGKMLEEDFAQISKICRVEKRNVVIKYDEKKVFHETVRYVDPEFLEMFTFPLKWGFSNSLSDLNSIILSEEMAIKYFGDKNPIGEGVKVIFDGQRSKHFEVAGVATEFPGARSFAFDFLIHFDNLKIADSLHNSNDWTSLIDATFVQIDNPSNLQVLKVNMEKYKLLQNSMESEWVISGFGFEPVSTLYQNSKEIRNDIAGNGFGTLYNSSIAFIIIGFLVLVLAASNYINIAIITAAKRLKEIGLRKVIGANRQMVIVQFLSENFLMMSIALVIGVILGATAFIPGLEKMMVFDMDFSLKDVNLFVYLIGVLLFTGIVSGLYPAIYISKFQVASIFRRAFRIGKKNYLTRAFLGFQLLLACVLISVAVMFTQNANYQSKRSWGYDQNEALYVHVHSQSGYEQLQTKLAQNPDVLTISGSTHHLGRSNETTLIDFPERQYEVSEMAVDHNYFQTLGIELKEGRLFREYSETDKKTVVVNETLVQNLSLDQPVGQTFKIDNESYQIVGVVKDFHSYDFYSLVKPTIFTVADQEKYQFLSMKVRPDSEISTNKILQDEWAELFPEIPFDGGFQEDVWGGFYEDMYSGSNFWKALASIVAAIASLGLYGLVTLNVSGRAREFSIRKVLGAEVRSIASIITRQYMVVFASVLLIGAPASYFLVQMIFDTFYIYYMPLNYTFFAFSGGILIAVLAMVIATQMKKIVKSNPVEGLKTE